MCRPATSCHSLSRARAIPLTAHLDKVLVHCLARVGDLELTVQSMSTRFVVRERQAIDTVREIDLVRRHNVREVRVAARVVDRLARSDVKVGSHLFFLAAAMH